MMKIMKTSTWSMIFWAAAYMTAMGGAGHAWADACGDPTVNHMSADCLTAVISNDGQRLSTQNVCTHPGSSLLLGKMVAEISVSNWQLAQPDGTTTTGTHVFLRTHSNTDTISTSIPQNSLDSRYTQVACCPSDGICDRTDCDTTDGVIDDGLHTSHCFQINDSDGTLMEEYSGKEIQNGQLVDASE